MKKSALLILPLLCTLLTGCQSREDIDTKLAKGCEAGVSYILNLTSSDWTISKVNKHQGENKKGERMMRKITINTEVSYEGYAEEQKNYSCAFAETYNFGFMGHSAEIVAVIVEDEIYGRLDGNLKNLSITQFQTLVGKIQRAMN